MKDAIGDPARAVSKTIAVVTRRADRLTALAEALTALGCQPLCLSFDAASSDPAKLASAFLVLVEIGADGHQEVGALVARLREALANHGPALVSFSTLGDPCVFDASREAQFDAHFVEPVPLARLLRLIEVA